MLVGVAKLRLVCARRELRKAKVMRLEIAINILGSLFCVAEGVSEKRMSRLYLFDVEHAEGYVV